MYGEGLNEVFFLLFQNTDQYLTYDWGHDLAAPPHKCCLLKTQKSLLQNRELHMGMQRS